MINKIDLSITSMITDRVGRHGVPLPINHNRYNFREKIHLGQTSPAGTMSKITFLYFRSFSFRISGCCYGYFDQFCDWWIESSGLSIIICFNSPIAGVR